MKCSLFIRGNLNLIVGTSLKLGCFTVDVTANINPKTELGTPGSMTKIPESIEVGCATHLMVSFQREGGKRGLIITMSFLFFWYS